MYEMETTPVISLMTDFDELADRTERLLATLIMANFEWLTISQVRTTTAWF